MKKYTIIKRVTCMMAGIALFGLNASAQPQIDNENTLGKPKIGLAEGTVLNMQPQTRKAPRREGSTSTADELVTEHFSNWTAGTMDAPDYENTLPAHIDPSMMEEGGTWASNRAFSAGGACALVWWGAQYQGQAYLMSPLGDYSGDLSISFRMKAIGNSAGVYVYVGKGGLGTASFANCDKSSSTFKTYKGQGWCRVNVKTSNYSADADGFIQILTADSVLIDDIEITSSVDNFIAAPTILPATNFTQTGFRANWQPVRKAYDYWVYLYKKVYKTEEEEAYFYDFNDAAELPEGWSVLQKNPELPMFSDNAGTDGSRALFLHDGDTLQSATFPSAMKNLKLGAALNGISGINQFYTRLTIQVLIDEDWEGYGSISCNYGLGPIIDFMERSKNAFNSDKIRAIRIIVTAKPDDEEVGGGIIIDDIDFQLARQYEFEPVQFGKYASYGYTYDFDIHETYYDFVNLDPLGEYYYEIDAHFMYVHGTSEKIFAFGLAAPEVQPATDIDDRGAYTANWEASPKATRYQVSNYGLYEATKDEAAHVVLEEDFDKIDEDVTTADDPANPEKLSNSKEQGYDDYTTLPGWMGIGNTIAQGHLGCAQPVMYYTWLESPAMYLPNDDHFTLTLKAKGTAGDVVNITIGNLICQAQVNEEGIIDGSVDIPVSGEAVVMHFQSSTLKPFMIDYVCVTQDLEQGEKVYTLLSSAETDAETLSYEFTGLSAYDFDNYAYNVVAYWDFEGSTAVSDPSAYENVIFVEPQDPSGPITQVTGINSNRELTNGNACYNSSGMQTKGLQHGLNIIRMGDGTVRKVVVK